MQKSNGVLKSKAFSSPKERLLKTVEAIPLRKAFILVILSFILSILLMPRITFFHPIYSIGSIAAKDIKADRDFLVEDKIATEQGRLDASRNTEPVFDYDLEVPGSISSRITSAFTIMSETYEHINRLRNSNTYFNSQDFIQRGREDSQRALGARFSDKEFEFFSRSLFSPDFQDQLIKFVYMRHTGHIL